MEKGNFIWEVPHTTTPSTWITSLLVRFKIEIPLFCACVPQKTRPILKCLWMIANYLQSAEQKDSEFYHCSGELVIAAELDPRGTQRLECKMKLLTIYIDTQPSKLGGSLDALGEIVRVKKPEFLAIQNVTNDTIKKVQATPWGSLYKIIQPSYKYETRKKPTTALLSTYPSQDFLAKCYHETPTGKMLLKGYFVMYDKQKQPFVICVGSTSLEQGLKVSEFREKQLNEACLSMIDDEDCFLMGGFGIDNDIDGELTLKGGWGDAWLDIPGNTESTGYTYDPDKNPLIKEDPFGPGRPDRLFYKSRHYKLDSMELVGNSHPSAASASAASVTLSTHYGLLTQFSPLDEMKPKAEHSILSALFNRTEWSVQFQESNRSKEKSGVSESEKQWSVQFQQSS